MFRARQEQERQRSLDSLKLDYSVGSLPLLPTLTIITATSDPKIDAPKFDLTLTLFLLVLRRLRAIELRKLDEDEEVKLKIKRDWDWEDRWKRDLALEKVSPLF